MAEVEIYTWQHCPYCNRAKALLDSKGVKYTEYKIDGDDVARDKMAKRTGGPRTVPQIFIDNQYVGGCDDLHALDNQGGLDPMLHAPRP